jgi:hypothetical protein
MNIFTRHPHSVGETYLQHLKETLKISAKHLVASVLQLIHGVFPFVYPPMGADVESMIKFLSDKKPESRKKNHEKVSR